jgi:hypothetical protein
MSIGWLVFIGLGAVIVVTVAWAAWSWLARSWEVLDDDALVDRLAVTPASPGLWMRLTRWLNLGGPPRLTYRRDKRGRFRRIWRG